MVNSPLFLPSIGIQFCKDFFPEALSRYLENSLAEKFFVSFPFLKLSSTSRTVIGMAMSCS
jgi:hypothetical protein